MAESHFFLELPTSVDAYRTGKDSQLKHDDTVYVLVDKRFCDFQK